MMNRKSMCISTGMLILASLRVWATSSSDRREAVATLNGVGTVWVDSLPAPPGTTLFPGDVVATGKASAAVLSFRSGASVALAENSQVTLSSRPSSVSGSERATGAYPPGWDRRKTDRATIPVRLELDEGVLVIRNATGEPTQVGVLGAAVLVKGQVAFPALCRIASVGRSAVVLADRGQTEIQGAGAPVVLTAGQRLSLGAAPATQDLGPMMGQVAVGRVTATIPDEVVQHAGLGVAVPLKLGEIVNSEDVIRTVRAGRVLIQLLDGTLLGLGMRSTLEITRHDPDSQQTQIELRRGYLRGEVTRVAKPGAKFLVRTPTADISVLQTVFVVGAGPNLADVCDVQGVAMVRNADRAVAGEVTLHTGECTHVAFGQRPSDPAPAAGLVSALTRQTTVLGPATARIAESGPTGNPTASRITLSEVVRKARVASYGVAAGLSTGTFFLDRAANQSLRRANSHLNAAAHDANLATAAANTAAADARVATSEANIAQATAVLVGCALNNLGEDHGASGLNTGVPSPFTPPAGTSCPPQPTRPGG